MVLSPQSSTITRKFLDPLDGEYRGGMVCESWVSARKTKKMYGKGEIPLFAKK